MLKQKLPRPKSCRVCKTKFTPSRAIQPVCSDFNCMLAYAQKVAAKSAIARQKKERIVTREKKIKLKTRSDWIREAQIEFNKYIRTRDVGFGCISCSAHANSVLAGGGADAGHYLSRGAKPHLRFDERNCHLQCKRCNRYLSGNVANYRPGIINRLGLEAVEALEADNDPRHYSIDDIKAIKVKYKEMTKALLKKRDN